MGKTLWSVQLTSMLPLGHPVPPETTFTILNAGGGVERFCGRAEATATTATTGSTNFMLECLVPEKWTRYVFANNPFSGSPQTHRPSYILPPTPHTHYCPEQNNHLLKVQTEPSPRAIYAHHSPSTTCMCRIGRQAGRFAAGSRGSPPPQAQLPSQAPRAAAPLRSSNMQPCNLPRRSRSYKDRAVTSSPAWRSAGP